MNGVWLGPTLQDLRHGSAGRLLEAAEVAELQDLGGWSSLESVERYSKITRERIREAEGAEEAARVGSAN